MVNAVTVDDGYADFHDVGYPIFREFGVPAMLFVATGFISREIWFWWDKLAYLMKEASPGEYLVDTGTKTVSMDFTSDAGRNTSWHMVADRCRFMKDERKESFLIDLADNLDIRLPSIPPAEYSPVTWDDIRSAEFLASQPEVNPARIAAMGLSMGSHRTWMLAAASDHIAAGAAICWICNSDVLTRPGNNQTTGQSAYSMLVPNLRNLLSVNDL